MVFESLFFGGYVLDFFPQNYTFIDLPPPPHIMLRHVVTGYTGRLGMLFLSETRNGLKLSLAIFHVPCDLCKTGTRLLFIKLFSIYQIISILSDVLIILRTNIL